MRLHKRHRDREQDIAAPPSSRRLRLFGGRSIRRSDVGLRLTSRRMAREFFGVGRASTASCLFRPLVWIDHIARLVLGRYQHDLRRDVLELAEIITSDMLELELQHARLRPLA
jgi:hypothetical protein